MARRTQFRIPGARTWVENIKNTVSEEAARQIVTDLKTIGPYWSGDFEAAWVVRAGDVRIRADKEPGGVRPASPLTRRVTSVAIPPAKGRKTIEYTIGNRMVYRDIALDLTPGRIKGGGRETAEQDWYRTYAEGGNLRLTLQQATNRAAKDPKIKGFRKKS